MAEVVAGSLASAVVKIAADKLRSAIAEQASLAWNFRKDLEYTMDTMESMEALLKDAEKQSVKNESVRLWLERLKYAAFDISDMMDKYQDPGPGSTAKMPGMFSSFTAASNKMVLANKIKNMRKKLSSIHEQGQCFNFIPSTIGSQDQPAYAMTERNIIGRDAEKKEIIDILSASQRKDGTMILPIYGLGGIGKSTLAHLVYSDTQLKQYYEHGRVWVYVSEVFDMKKIGNSIISQLLAHESHQNSDTLQMISNRLGEMLPGKKILIVLDDIWEEDALKLDKLKDMLCVDKKGSVVDVLVTTRNEYVANRICTNELFKLEPLAPNVCWDIIKTCSRFEDKSNKIILEEIGLDIAKKCGGLALGAQALGYILQSKDLNNWLEINKSDVWNESFGVHDPQHKEVLPSLKLCYERMLPVLRLCFSYCAIFPKGHHIYEDDLVHQWIALDFIKKPSEGKEFINQLLGMSFLEHSKLPTISRDNVRRYTMHDLVHDLARSVVDDEAIVIDAGGEVKTSKIKYCRYALLVNYDGQELSDILPKKVHALHFSSSSKMGSSDASFSFAKNLRVLDLSECSSIHLPSFICQLKQLKCLIAPELQDKSLPGAIVQLTKLQYLNLSGSSLISALPESIGKLSCLKYLCLSGCSGISKVPGSFGGLKNLMHLDMSDCSGLTGLPAALGNMTMLHHLDLSKCYGVKELPESLGGLIQLQHLNLSCCGSITRLPEASGYLTNLQYLDIKSNVQIAELPGSFQNLQNLVHLDLSGCCCAKGLPEVLCCLTTLRHLNMSGFSVDQHFWKDLSYAIGNLSKLKYLNMCDSGIDHFLDFVGTLTDLEHLVLSENYDIESLPDSIGNLKKLHTLDLSQCISLKFLPDSIGNLKNLHTLDLSGCPNLRSLPDSISEIAVLKSLLIDGCSDELMELANSKLDYSLTLPLFKVRADIVMADSNLPLLEHANVTKLTIQCLENVQSLEEASKVKLLDKDKLLDLALAWNLENAVPYVDDEDLLLQLLPPRGLKSFSLEGYRGQSFPSWFMDISHHLPNLVTITLDALPKCNKLPPLGQLPNLEMLSLRKCHSITKIGKDLCGGNGAFRRLSLLVLSGMLVLEEWCTTHYFEDGVEEFMFPVLEKLDIEDCPKLRFTPCPPVCCVCIIQRSDEIISSLERLGNNIGHIRSSTPTTTLTILGCNSKSLRVFHHFSVLQVLEIVFCDDLTSLPESMRHLKYLQSLKLRLCNSISALPEWLGDLTSLRSLTIDSCGSLKSFPPSIRQLKTLQTLRIDDNTELKQWCESEENKQSLAHINNIIYG